MSTIHQSPTEKPDGQTTETALVLTSGGQDSTTCLYWARQRFGAVQAIAFDYHQRHANELVAAAAICAKLAIPYKQVDLAFLSELSTSSLFAGGGDLSVGHQLNPAVPASFVPYRNLLFLTLAAAWASTNGIRHLVTGVCQTDFSGYADCREIFVRSAESTINLSTDFTDRPVKIHTPLMWLTKAQTFGLAAELGCLNQILTDTRTCYEGNETVNDFGRGCGSCPACQLRRKGWLEYQQSLKS